MREALDDLGNALDDTVDPAAVIAGEPAQYEREREGERDADDADSERYARRIDDATEHVASQPVGAQPEEGPVLRWADEVEAAFDQAPELVALAQTEEAELLRLGRVG